MARINGRIGWAALLALAGCAQDGSNLGSLEQASEAELDNLLSVFSDESGQVQTATPTGTIDTSNPFFQSLGVNGRTCFSCHRPSQGWTITPADLQARFDASDGTDPVFRAHDGANSPAADVSTVEARRQAYSMLLSRGVIRIDLPVKPTAQFTLAAVDDPYGFASATHMSLFRRPLPTMNLRFIATVNWDGRNMLPGFSVTQALLRQSNGATVNHAQLSPATPLSDATRNAIVALETSLNTAQITDQSAKRLDVQGAFGGPSALLGQPFSIGINDSFGPDFDPVSIVVFEPWEDLGGGGNTADARRDVGEGESIFYTKPISISGVNGLNDVLGQPVVVGTCTTCHDTPNVGGNSQNRFFDTGVSDGVHRKPEQPLYTLVCNATGVPRTTTDPGRALISDRCADIGAFKVPGLRSLAARAPYFHDGSAARIEDVIDFYDQRFGINYTEDEKAALAHFLRSL